MIPYGYGSQKASYGRAGSGTGSLAFLASGLDESRIARFWPRQVLCIARFGRAGSRASLALAALGLAHYSLLAALGLAHYSLFPRWVSRITRYQLRWVQCIARFRGLTIYRLKLQFQIAQVLSAIRLLICQNDR